MTVLILIALMSKKSYGTPLFDDALIPSEGNKYEMTAPIAEIEVEYWTCPMHPELKMEESGKCPHCGMDLTPVMTKSGPGTLPPTGNDMNDKDQSPGKNSPEGAR